MISFITNFLYNFLIAFGVIIGGASFAAIGALITNHPPLKTMLDVSRSIKIWAVALALGGTFSSFQVIERGLLKGEIKSVLKQLLYIFAALVGANLACVLLKLLKRCSKLWLS
ncbi:MAG: sporulation protein [Firmicutes bacterium]|nr:sporulation protein [Bacillota bacterium]